MMNFLVICAFSAFTFVRSEDGRGDLCRGDKPFPCNNLPQDVQPDFLSILKGAANALGGSCLGIEPNYENVELLLYTNTSKEPTRLSFQNPVGIDNNAPLYILTHGWLSGVDGYKIPPFREKYVEIYGRNILFVNWGRLAWYPYITTACNIQFIAQRLAEMIAVLDEKQKFDVSNIHIIGHSFGGQLAGLTGKAVQRLCNKKIGRITALDPAGPMYQLTKESNRLMPTDAEFVEVVHSNSGLFGYLGKAGTVDYHLNCGTAQPGCIIPQEASKILETSINLLACAHIRSLELWPYVLESRQFIAKSCKWCPFVVPGVCVTNIFNPDFITMGHIHKRPKRESYYVATGPYAPFQLGCSAYNRQGCS